MFLKRFLVVFVVLILLMLFFAFGGSEMLENNLNFIAVATPVFVFLILIVLVMNTWNQYKIIDELKSLNEKVQPPEEMYQEDGQQ